MNQPLSDANGAVVWLVCLAIGFVLSIFHSISEIKERKAKRLLEAQKFLDKKQSEMKGQEFPWEVEEKKVENFEYEESDPIYGRLIDDGNTVLTDEGEVIYIRSDKDGKNA